MTLEKNKSELLNTSVHQLAPGYPVYHSLAPVSHVCYLHIGFTSLSEVALNKPTLLLEIVNALTWNKALSCSVKNIVQYN